MKGLRVRINTKNKAHGPLYFWFAPENNFHYKESSSYIHAVNLLIIFPSMKESICVVFKLCFLNSKVFVISRLKF